jgi:hypothetical protein
VSRDIGIVSAERAPLPPPATGFAVVEFLPNTDTIAEVLYGPVTMDEAVRFLSSGAWL